MGVGGERGGEFNFQQMLIIFSLFFFLARSFVNYFVSNISYSRYNMHQQKQKKPQKKPKIKIKKFE
jgi:hypothetical protein